MLRRRAWLLARKASSGGAGGDMVVAAVLAAAASKAAPLRSTRGSVVVFKGSGAKGSERARARWPTRGGVAFDRSAAHQARKFS